jgi:Histidine kinase-like ATPase domain
MGSDTDADQSHRPDGETSQRAAVRAETTPGALRWRQVFSGEERHLGAMRRWLTSLLPDCPSRDDVLSVATELGNNAVQHTASGRGGWFAVEVGWHRSVVQVAVTDCGGPGEPGVIDDPDGERGRGLLLVRALSVRHGFAGDQRGRIVWAQVAWDDPQDAAASSRDPYLAAIRDGEAALAHRFAGVPAWFGRSTLMWWAVVGSEGLVSAPSAPELAELLSRLLDARQPHLPVRGDAHHGAAGQRVFRQYPDAGGRDDLRRRRHRLGTGRTWTWCPDAADEWWPGRAVTARHPALLPDLVATEAASLVGA